MTNDRKIMVSLAILSIFALIACGVKQRIKENQSYFDSLNLATQETIREAEIEIGFTPRMVYLAWGNPTDKSAKVQNKKESETWIYTYYHTDYDTEQIGYYDLDYRHFNTGFVQLERSYFVMDRYVIFENGKVIEYGRPHQIFYVPVTTIYPSYCGFFSIHSRYGCGSFDRMFIPRLQKLKKTR